MSDPKTYTKDELDSLIDAAVSKVQESVDRLETKNTELIGENRRLKRAGEIKPEDFAALESEVDRLKGELTKAQGDLKTANTAKEKAEKALETESGAARTYALDAEIANAIAAGNVVPALVPAFKALVRAEAKADVVDGKYVVTIGDKPAADHIKTLLASDEGKHFVAAAGNSGGGAPGGKSGGQAGKQMTRSAFSQLDPEGRAAFAKEGGTLVDDAA